MSKDKPANVVAAAEVTWSGDVPVSNRFDDIYFSKENGLEESNHVFIRGNRLDQRWPDIDSNGTFTIIETGFGTGLNFLAAAKLWLATAGAGARLEYVALEKYPLKREQLKTALSRWPALASLAKELLAAYPPPLGGIQRRWLYRDRVALTLVFDDAAAGLDSLLPSDHPAFIDTASFRADAWFLDGFAPAKNPDLWSDELFALMPRLSHTGTTLATFTVARKVREGLRRVGFELDKAPGYGRKRDMLRGVLTATGTEPAATPSRLRPRNSQYAPTWPLFSRPDSDRKRAIVLGAGIAGCSTAAALTRRGWRICLMDRHPAPGREASGNPQGILYPRLSPVDSPLAALARHALCYASTYYPPYWRSGGNGEQCGVLVLPENPGDGERFATIAACFQEAGDMVIPLFGDAVGRHAGVSLAARSALFFPQLGWVEPPALCRWLCRDLEFVHAEVAALHRGADTWHLLDGRGNIIDSAPTVVIANSHGASTFAQCNHLPLKKIRGQISAVPVTPDSSALRTVICGAGYIAPGSGGSHTLGASYGIDDDGTDIRREDHQHNFRLLAETDAALPELLRTQCFTEESGALEVGGRAAVRCTTPDYLPIAGPAPDAEKMLERFAGFRRNAKSDIPLAGAWHPGLWLNCGHGSRGLTYAPLASELLACQINGDPPPLPRTLVTALNPARFLIRSLKRGVPT